MSEAPNETAYPWLPPADVTAWLQLADPDLIALAEECRLAAAAFVEQARRDLVTVVDGTPQFAATPDIKLAGLIAAARLYARRTSPTGLVSYAEFGASDILRIDPDVDRLLQIGRYAPPRVG